MRRFEEVDFSQFDRSFVSQEGVKHEGRAEGESEDKLKSRKVELDVRMSSDRPSRSEVMGWSPQELADFLKRVRPPAGLTRS